MAYLSDNEKAILLTDLIDLAKSDGVVNFSEMTYLLWVSQKLGVNQEELTKLMDRKNSTFDRVSSSQRLEQFHRLLSMMYVDTEIDVAELEKCRELAYNMGLDRTKVDNLLTEIAKNPGVRMDLETLKGKFEGR